MKSKALFFIGVLCLLVASLTVNMVVASTASYPFVLPDGSLETEKYFEIENLNIRTGEDYFDFVLNKPKATVSFKKELAADNFSISFVGSAKNIGFKHAAFYLTDAENKEISIKVSYHALSDSMTGITLNDSKRSYVVAASLYTDNSYDFTFTYDKEVRTLSDNGSFLIPIKTTVSGEAFDGFPSGKVLLSAELEGAEGSFLRLKSIDRQRFGEAYRVDKTEPMICISSMPNNISKNSTVTLPTAFAMDVLSEKANLKMTVKDPEGNVISATDGTKLQNVDAKTPYKVKIEKIGIYRMEYKASDGKNSTRTIVSQINVSDRQCPQLEISAKVPSKITVQKEYTFPKIKVSDNVSRDIKKWITVKHPDGTISTEEQSFVPDAEGRYDIAFYAMDEAGNIRRVLQKTYADGAEETKK